MAVLTIPGWVSAFGRRNTGHRHALTDATRVEWSAAGTQAADRASIEITSSVDGLRHQVLENSIVAAPHERGEYRAMCGRTLVPLAMVCPEGPPCARCSDLQSLRSGRSHHRRNTPNHRA